MNKFFLFVIEGVNLIWLLLGMVFREKIIKKLIYLKIY